VLEDFVSIISSPPSPCLSFTCTFIVNFLPSLEYSGELYNSHS
jgi:hypothetical protein